jgi:dihydroorotate dehydrogenase (fumarate)
VDGKGSGAHLLARGRCNSLAIVDWLNRVASNLTSWAKSGLRLPLPLPLPIYSSRCLKACSSGEPVPGQAHVSVDTACDIDLKHLDVRPHILLSTPQAVRLPLRWIAMLQGRVRADLAASGGIHTGQDAIKMVMAGANVTMLYSALLKRGIQHISVIEAGP